jgi:CRP-like cAMP-binding protein
MKHIAWLDELRDTDRRTLLDRSVERFVARDEIIHLAGDRPERVHIVLEGIVKLAARDGNGDETILGLTAPGGTVGDMAAIDGCGQPLDAITATPCRLAGIDAELFVDVIFRNPGAALELARADVQRTRWMIETALERTSGEIEERLAGRLLDLAHMLGRPAGDAIELELPVGQRDLGKLAGMCRESACKTLRRMKADGVLDYEGRRLRILRPDSLRLMRCGRARD